MVAVFGLPAMVGVTVILGVLVFAGRWLPPSGIVWATAGLCLLAALLALAMVGAGGQSQLLAGGLAVDPLSAFFLLLPAVAGLAASCGWLGQAAPAILPGIVAAAFLVILAGDAQFAILGIALFVWASSGRAIRPSNVACIFLLAAAFAVLAMGSGHVFASIRATPPDGLRAVIVVALSLIGLAPLVGWIPWHQSFLGLPVVSISPVLALYLAVRVLADLCGPATPGWWGLPLLLAGGASAVIGVVSAVRAAGFPGILAGFGVQHGGWMLAGLGVALVARSADLLPLATLALGGTLLHALNYTVFAALAGVAAQTAAIGSGSQTLDRLGGLAARMPIVAMGMLVAGFSLALLPPSAGFASGWMLLQGLFAAPRIGGLPLQLTVMVVVGGLALSAGLASIAMIRLVGVAFLGRPRSPRAAAADGATPAQRGAIIGLTVLCALLGFFPGLGLQVAGQAQRVVTASGLDGQGGWFGVQTQFDTPGYAPWGIVLGVGACLGVVAILARSGRLPSAQSVPAWEGGFAAPPAWMPFGDPATQVTSVALAATLPATRLAVPSLPRLRLRVEGSWPSVGWRQGSAAILGLTVLLLLLVAALGLA
jgi:formate hydrogenlyase subunit 3/multisubunit Na+/H+ antiporter MnhD subunit